MLERLKKVIEANLPEQKLGDIKPESRLIEDLGMDSIGMMMLSMSIEDEFGVVFDGPVKFVTVQDVIDYLSKNATK